MGTQEYAGSVIAVIIYFVVTSLERNGFWETLGAVGYILKHLFKIYSCAFLGIVFIGGIFWLLMSIGIPKEYGSFVWFGSIIIGGYLIIKVTDYLSVKKT